MFICPFLSSDGEDLRCLWLGGDLGFLVSLLVQLCGSRHAGHYHLHLLPAEVLCVLYQPARACSSAFAVWVRHLWMGRMESNVWKKAEDPVDICLCASPGGPSRLSCTQPPSCSRSPAQPTWSSPAWTSSLASMAVWPRLCWSSSPTMWVLWKEMLGWPFLEPEDSVYHDCILLGLWCWPPGVDRLDFCSLSFLGLHSISCFSFSLYVSDQIFLFLLTSSFILLSV